MATKQALKHADGTEVFTGTALQVADREAQLAPLDEARQYLEMAKAQLAMPLKARDVKTIRDLGAAMLEGSKKRKLGIESENIASEIILRAERRMGQLIPQMQESGELAARSNPIGTGVTARDTGLATLDDLGIGRMDSSRWQRLGRLDDESFEMLLTRLKISETGGEKRLAKFDFYSLLPSYVTTPEQLETAAAVMHQAAEIARQNPELPVTPKLLQQAIKRAIPAPLSDDISSDLDTDEDVDDFDDAEWAVGLYSRDPRVILRDMVFGDVLDAFMSVPESAFVSAIPNDERQAYDEAFNGVAQSIAEKFTAIRKAWQADGYTRSARRAEAGGSGATRTVPMPDPDPEPIQKMSAADQASYKRSKQGTDDAANALLQKAGKMKAR